jgi:arylsulfatase A-like enzyme
MRFQISGILLAFLLITVGTSENAIAQNSNSPNVIVIICDDLNDAIHGMGGHPQAITPNIDRLAQQGVRFTNAQCNAPICGPSRASLWSGLYPHTTGYFGYNQQQNHWRRNKVLSSTVTLFEHFAQNGYQVFGSGKIHHNGHEDNSIFINEDGSDGFKVEASFGPYPWNSDPATATVQKRGVMHPDFPESMKNSGCFEGFGEVRNISETYGGKGSWLYDHWGKEYQIESAENRDLMPDEACTEYALSLLKQKHDKPFFLTVGFNRPHSPQYVPEKYFDMYGLDSLILSPSLDNDIQDCAPLTMAAKDVHGVNTGSHKYKKYFKAGGEEMIKRWTQAYLASVTFVDDQVGQIMEALKESDYAGNTIIIFTSDHGYHMGEKELIFKNTLWEESTRVPMVIAGPGVTSSAECSTPISLIDIYPTLMEYCDLPLFPNKDGNKQDLDGHSILPLLKNPENGIWNGPGIAVTAVCSQQKLQVNQPGPVDQQQYSVRSERYRYILYRNGEEELYDQLYDPYEWFNLANDPSYSETKSQLKKDLKKLLADRN